MSKVVHIRLSDEAIFVCMKVLQDSNVDIKNLSLATIIRRYIEGSTSNYRSQVGLAIPDGVGAIVNSITNSEETPISMPTIAIMPEQESNFDKNKMENIQRAIENATAGKERPEFEIQDVVEKESVLPPPPWKAHGIIPWETIQSMSPKDILVEKAIDDVILQRAIQCVYTDTPTHEWGNKHVIELVQKVIPTIELYYNNEEEK